MNRAPNQCHTAIVTRRLRFALFLAALAAAGPIPATRAVDAVRVAVTIAWADSDRVVAPTARYSDTKMQIDSVAPRVSSAHLAPVLSPALLAHSLFQRPPPLQN
jgi:hypothetical protein